MCLGYLDGLLLRLLVFGGGWRFQLTILHRLPDIAIREMQFAPSYLAIIAQLHH